MQSQRSSLFSTFVQCCYYSEITGPGPRLIAPAPFQEPNRAHMPTKAQRSFSDSQTPSTQPLRPPTLTDRHVPITAMAVHWQKASV
jgi:hypothetical protein